MLVINFNLFSQTTIDLSDGVNLVINGGTSSTPIYVVVDNNATNAVTTSGTGGSIVAEGEYNIFQWNINTGTGTYTVPLGDGTNKFPLAVNVTNAGVGASGNIQFSNIPGPDYLNSGYMPSDVTDVNHMGSDNSDKVIDRFWIINAQNYTTKPEVTLSFTYKSSEVSAVGNSITEANLQAQRWNSTSGKWSDFGPIGSVNTGTKVVSSVVVPAADFYKSWTIVDNTSPLPVQLLSFTSQCYSNYYLLKWNTISELNNEYYVLEGSLDGQHFIKIDSLKGKNISYSQQNYQLMLSKTQNANYQYFRLSQKDFNGKLKLLKTINVPQCEDQNNDFVIYSNAKNQVHIQSYLSQKGNYQLKVLDINGRIIHQSVNDFEKGKDQLDISLNASAGLYLIQIVGENNNWNQKFSLE